MASFDVYWYLAQQKKLGAQPVLRWWWKSWAVYSQALLVAFGLYLLATKQVFLFIIYCATWVVARFVISEIIYLLYKKPRPWQRFGFKPATSWFFSYGRDKPDSFPSGHVAGMVAVSCFLLFYYPWVGVAGLAASFLTSWGRVLFGYHFPVDIFAAFAIGLVWGYGAYLLVPYVLPLFL